MMIPSDCTFRISLRHAGIATLFVLLGSLPLQADEFARHNNEGNKLAKQEQFDQALQRYHEARVERPDRPEVGYNIGNVYHLEGKFDSAAKEYQNALSALTGPVAPQASYNLGNTLFRMQQYGPAIEAYKGALIENPSDIDAKHNLELALRRLQADSTKQQQKQDDQKNKSDSTQQNKDKKDKQPKPDSTQDNQKSGQDKKPPTDSTQGQPPPSGQDNQKPGGQKKDQQPQQPVGMTKADAQRLLDALKNDELKVQKQRAQRLNEVKVTRDW